MKLYNIYKTIILEETINLICESVDYTQINDAIANKYNVNIEYKDNENSPPSKRYIQVYAVGLTKAGNPVIRAYQIFGGTTSKTPEWKFFRLDRITKWDPKKGAKFYKPISDVDPSIGKFNPTGDKTMSQVNNIVKFNK